MDFYLTKLKPLIWMGISLCRCVCVCVFLGMLYNLMPSLVCVCALDCGRFCFIKEKNKTLPHFPFISMSQIDHVFFFFSTTKTPWTVIFSCMFPKFRWMKIKEGLVPSNWAFIFFFERKNLFKAILCHFFPSKIMPCSVSDLFAN